MDVCMHLESPLPFVFGVVCKTPLFGLFSILVWVVSCKKGLLSSKQVLAIYTKLDHVSVLCLSCLMLNQAPSHVIQTQAHD